LGQITSKDLVGKVPAEEIDQWVELLNSKDFIDAVDRTWNASYKNTLKSFLGLKYHEKYKWEHAFTVNSEWAISKIIQLPGPRGGKFYTPAGTTLAVHSHPWGGFVNGKDYIHQRTHSYTRGGVIRKDDFLLYRSKGNVGDAWRFRR